MNDSEHRKPSEEELRAIQAMRSFRRLMGMATAALVLLAAIVLAIRHMH